MVAGAVGVFVRFDAFKYLEIVGGGVEALDEVEAFRADDGVRGPADIEVWMACYRGERRILLVAEP